MIELLVTLSVLAGPDYGPTSLATSAVEQQHLEVHQNARDYRLQIYRSFRMNRQEFDRRRLAGNNVLRAWGTAGRRPKDGDAVIRWFDVAMRASVSGSTQPVPVLPTIFGPSIGQPVPETSDVISGFDFSAGFEDAATTGEAGAVIGIDPPTDAPNVNDLSPIESLRRAIIKATSNFSQESGVESDTLPEWPGDESPQSPEETQ